MNGVQLTMLAIVVTGVTMGLARRLGVPAQTTVFMAGLGAGLLPGVPRVEIEPALVLDLFLTILSYAAAAGASVHLFRQNFIAGLAAGSAFTLTVIAACAVVSRALLGPSFDWPAAVLLGVIAVGAEDAFQTAKDSTLPRRLTDALRTQRQIAAVVIVSTFLATKEIVERQAKVGDVLLARVGLDLLLGVSIGAVVGWLFVRLRTRLVEPEIELGVSLATPFVVALAASFVGASAVPAILAAGLVVGAHHVDRRTGEPLASPQARIAAQGFWRAISTLLGGALFFVSGLLLPTAMRTLDESRWMAVVLAALLALIVLPATMFLCIWLSAWLPELAPIYRAKRTPRSRTRDAVAIAWASLRSPLALVVALAVPERMGDQAWPERDFLLVFAGVLVAISLLIQAVTWRPVLHWLAGSRSLPPDRQELASARRVLQKIDASHRGHHLPTRSGLLRLEVLRLRRENSIGDEDMNRLLLEVDERVDLMEART